MRQLTGSRIGNSKGVEGFHNASVGSTYLFPPIELAKQYHKSPRIDRSSAWIIKMAFITRTFTNAGPAIIVGDFDNEALI